MNLKQDIEYFSVVDGVMDVFILVGRRQLPLSRPLENDGVRVLQVGSPRHFYPLVHLIKSLLLRTSDTEPYSTTESPSTNSDTSCPEMTESEESKRGQSERVLKGQLTKFYSVLG